METPPIGCKLRFPECLSGSPSALLRQCSWFFLGFEYNQKQNSPTLNVFLRSNMEAVNSASVIFLRFFLTRISLDRDYTFPFLSWWILSAKLLALLYGFRSSFRPEVIPFSLCLYLLSFFFLRAEGPPYCLISALHHHILHHHSCSFSLPYFPLSRTPIPSHKHSANYCTYVLASSRCPCFPPRSILWANNHLRYSLKVNASKKLCQKTMLHSEEKICR